MRAASDNGVPRCVLCGGAMRLLYPSNVPEGAPIEKGELACTSPYLSVHDDIFICRACGLARSAPPVQGDALDELYHDVEDPEYHASEPERRAAFRESLERIGRHPFVRPGGRLLEIGSAAGLFLDEAQRAGWDAVGIEPSRWGAEASEALGASVFHGTLDAYQAEPSSFDVIVSWDVWEHLEDPVGALDKSFTLLKPGGLFAFTTVNMGGLGAKLFRGRWPWFMRMHLHYFTEAGLGALVSRAGFEVLSMGTEAKRLKIGYLLERSRSFLGPLARAASGIANGLGVAEKPVSVDLGDILLVEARKPA